MITRDDLKASRMRFVAHMDASNCFENHYVNETWSRLTCVTRGPRGRRPHPKIGKFFFVDGVEVTRCSELLERLNGPAPATTPIGTDESLARAAVERSAVS